MIFTNEPLLVIGDLMLDEYIYGTCTRISPEAPVPVIKRTKIDERPGGAANVAANIRSLGGVPHTFGLIGHDRSATFLDAEFFRLNMWRHGLVKCDDRPTTTKTRIVANGQQIARVDLEDTSLMSAATRTILCAQIANTEQDKPVSVVVSDYAKGSIVPEVLEAAFKWCVPVFIDPKVVNASCYEGYSRGFITCITPNLHEAEGLCRMEISSEESLNRAGRVLLSRFSCEYALITRGEDGLSLFSHDKAPLHVPASAKEVFDVSGAGDTVIATLALSFSSGYSMEDSARLANVAAGIVVGKHGTSPVDITELSAEQYRAIRQYRDVEPLNG